MKKIWTQITKDEFELPVIVADTAKELAEIVGVHVSTVVTGRHRLVPEYISVEVDDEDD